MTEILRILSVENEHSEGTDLALYIFLVQSPISQTAGVCNMVENSSRKIASKNYLANVFLGRDNNLSHVHVMRPVRAARNRKICSQLIMHYDPYGAAY